MKKYLLLCIIWFSQLFANLIYPPDESELNYTHVMFKWEAVEHVTEFEFELSSSSDFYTRLISDKVYDTQYLVTDKISWESTYYWRVRTVGGSWHDTYSFTTSSTCSDVIVTWHDPSQYAEGNTIFGIGDGYCSAVIDKNGTEIWNSGSDNIIYYNFLDYGRFYGARYEPAFGDNNLPSVKFSLEDGIEWETPNDLNDLFTMHEFIELPWGDYMGIVKHDSLGPIHATGNMQLTYQGLGYAADGVTNEFPWLGHRLVIWDKDTELVVWSWSSFEGFSMLDYDITVNEWNTSLPQSNGYFDWTHINAFYFDERDSSIYISTRNLDRITKLQYPSGDIIWNMGRESASDEVTFGHDLGFSHQHSISLTDEDNILIFDNGNYAAEYWGADETTSRALEIAVSGSDGNYSASVAFEYILDDDLFGEESGNVQKLVNGNYLITTTGDDGTTLEVTPTGDPVWEANYGTNFIYRASRIPECFQPIGEINDDGGFNVQDIVLLVTCILVENCIELDHACAADLNGDGGFNVADVVILVQCILVDNCGG